MTQVETERVDAVAAQLADVPWVIQRTGDRDLLIVGQLLGVAGDRVRSGQLASRWSECRIYSIAGAAGRYVVARAKLSCWQGELDFHRAIVCGSPGAVVDALTVDGTLGHSEKAALQEAAVCDAGLRDVLYVVP